MGDGHWIGETTLAAAPHGHFTGARVSVAKVLHGDLTDQLQARLTPRAATELQKLEELLQGTLLTDEIDVLSCCFEDGSHKLMTPVVCKASSRGEHTLPSFPFV